MAVAPELVHALSEVSELESALAQASLSREGEALTPRSRQQLAALTGRVKALGASLTTLTKHPLIAEASNAAAMKEFAARFRAALLSFHAVQNGTPPSAIGQTPSPTFTTGSPAPADERKGKVRKFKMRGELKKLGAKGVTQWRRRYMKVEGDKLLYFLDERDLKPRGAIDLLLMSDVDWETAPNQVYEGEPGEDEASGPSRFRIRTPGRDYHLEADTPRLARLWVRSLRDWKQRSATMSQVRPTEEGERAAGGLAAEMAAFAPLQDARRDREHEELNLLAHELEERRRERALREEERLRERLMREEERQRRTEAWRAAPPEPSPTLPTTPAPPLPEPEPIAPDTTTTNGGADGMRLRAASVAPPRQAPSRPSGREPREEQLREHLAAMVEKHLRLSSQLQALRQERSATLAQLAALASSDEELQRLRAALSWLDAQHAYLDAACDWGYQRARTQAQLHTTLLAVQERRLAAEQSQCNQQRLQLGLEEETLRHQIAAQTHRIVALKETWEHLHDQQAAAKEEWTRRLTRERSAHEAHQHQHALQVQERTRLLARLERTREEMALATSKLRAMLGHARDRTQQLRLRSLALTPAPEQAPSLAPGPTLPAGSLAAEIAVLRRAYFQALALSVKLSFAQQQGGVAPSVSLDQLWEAAERRRVPWLNLPRFLTAYLRRRMLGEPSDEDEPEGQTPAPSTPLPAPPSAAPLSSPAEGIEGPASPPTSPRPGALPTAQRAHKPKRRVVAIDS